MTRSEDLSHGLIALTLMGAMIGLAGCTTAQVSDTQAALSDLCQAYAAAAPSLNPAQGSTEANLLAYAKSACTLDGQIQPSLPVDASTPAWLADIETGLQIAVPIATMFL